MEMQANTRSKWKNSDNANVKKRRPTVFIIWAP